MACFLAGEADGLLVLTVAAAETGSGVPAALAGRHFNTVSPRGLPAGQALGEILLRSAAWRWRERGCGQARPPGEVDADFRVAGGVGDRHADAACSWHGGSAKPG